jgi:hypothetical protein
MAKYYGAGNSDDDAAHGERECDTTSDGSMRTPSRAALHVFV